MRLLIVEDEETLSSILQERLQQEGYQIDVAENYQDASYFIQIRNYDLVVANWLLPDKNGMELVALAKSVSPRTCVIVLSSSSDKKQEIQALKNGADDYVRKPYDVDVLLARIECRLKISGTNIIEVFDLKINPDEERIFFKNKEVELKGKPFEVLYHLARYKDKIVSKEQLLDAIWEEPELVTPNVIEVAINQIRQKLDKPLGISSVETIRRRGYKFCYSNEGADK